MLPKDFLFLYSLTVFPTNHNPSSFQMLHVTSHDPFVLSGNILLVLSCFKFSFFNQKPKKWKVNIIQYSESTTILMLSIISR